VQYYKNKTAAAKLQKLIPRSMDTTNGEWV